MKGKTTSKKPYLIRAYYDWLIDNDLTPYLLVDAEHPDVDVPEQHVSDGKIVLNISPSSCRGLHLENDRIVLTTKFSGYAVQIFIVPSAVLAIYAKENGDGIEFPIEDEDTLPANGSPANKDKKRPQLKLVDTKTEE